MGFLGGGGGEVDFDVSDVLKLTSGLSREDASGAQKGGRGQRAVRKSFGSAGVSKAVKAVLSCTLFWMLFSRVQQPPHV